MIEVANALSYNQNFILRGSSFPCPCAVYMYKIMILLNIFSSETTWPIFDRFHGDPTGLRICSNGHAPLTGMPIYGKILIIKNAFFLDDPFISCNNRIGKMLRNIYISAVAIPLR